MSLAQLQPQLVFLSISNPAKETTIIPTYNCLLHLYSKILLLLLILYVLVVHIDTEHVIFSLFFDTISLVMFSNGYVDRFHHGHVTINNENFQRNVSFVSTITGEIGKIP